MYIFVPLFGMEQGHVVSMHAGPSAKPYLDDFTTRLQLYNENTGVEAAEKVWQFLCEFSFQLSRLSTCFPYTYANRLLNNFVNILAY